MPTATLDPYGEISRLYWAIIGLLVCLTLASAMAAC